MAWSAGMGRPGCPARRLPGARPGRAPPSPLGAAPALSLPPRSLLVAVGLVDCGVTLATMLADISGCELVAMLLSGVCIYACW